MVKGIISMLIGELAKRSGLTRDTIRFYEKESLIGPEKKVRGGFPSNTYKNYPESTVATLTFIQRTKVLGFTLGEIREMLKNCVSPVKGRVKNGLPKQRPNLSL